MSAPIPRTDHHKNNVIKQFNEACSRHNSWSVWSDFIVMTAISISNIVDKSHAGAREETYKSLVKKYNERELTCFGKMFSEIVLGIDASPDQDFLGELYMALELGNQHKGQFFTPYTVCRAMAAMTYGNDLKEKIKRQGWVSVSDPACGAGALLIAFANECRRPGHDVNYQTSVLFAAQDIDLVAGLMCYIQLSLLGCPGYVSIADTLTEPTTSLDDRGLIPVPSENLWYTPFYFRDVWHWRRILAQLDILFKSEPAKTQHLPNTSDEHEADPTSLTEEAQGQLLMVL